ncbi:unnamed protein product [Owenia fusiformis]|uniref:Uncharacterized protein n=1 Tax=Owenia fusiformis TaxID=6347 RepID=A0A8J1TSX7_OWEFU|nr:unnamed protein product [Owenia fusiformis]
MWRLFRKLRKTWGVLFLTAVLYVFGIFYIMKHIPELTDSPRCATLMKRPKLSWLYCSRNDVYRGQAMARLRLSLRSLLRGLRESKLLDVSEIIITDWNSHTPLYNESTFNEILAKENAEIPFFVIHICEEIAQKYAESEFSEPHSLNVASRFAHGEMLIRLDQDTMVGPAFFKWLNNQRILNWPNHNKAWFSGRRDTSKEEYDSVMAHGYQFIKEHEKEIGHWSHKRDFLGGAIGVLAVPKDVFQCIGGYNENNIYFGFMEYGIYCRLHNLNVPIININYFGMSIHAPFYHIWHERSDNKKWNDEFSNFSNNEYWGLSNESLPVFYCNYISCRYYKHTSLLDIRHYPTRYNGQLCHDIRYKRSKKRHSIVECPDKKLPKTSRFILV